MGATRMDSNDVTAGLTIGQLASEAGVTAETIRFYEREGVIPKAERGGAGRYRRYRETDAERLRFVRRARDLGFSLDEVRDLLSLAAGDPRRSCGDVDAMAREHLAQVNAKIAQLTALRAELTRLMRACKRDAPIENCTLLNALSGR
jgi:DNA-binding transcriptional MerR regulator